MRLEDLEAGLRELLEVRLVRGLPGQQTEDELARRIAEAIETNARTEPGGGRTAPNAYTLFVYGAAGPRLQDSVLARALIQVIKAAASDAGLRLDAEPTLNIADDPNPNAEGFRIVASHHIETVGETQDMKADTEAPEADAESPALPHNAFLIVNGTREVALTRVVVNIGRRLDNDLVLDDPRVSRHHAQLRAINGRYVLFDLESSSGTYINGQRTSQAILHTGDVISLAGVSLIYGEDGPLAAGEPGQTAPRGQTGTEPTTPTMDADLGPPGKQP